MNRPPPEHQASSSSRSRHRRRRDDGEIAGKLVVVEQNIADCEERLFLSKWTRLPSILASSPPTPANDETESRDHDDCSGGAGPWRPWADIATPLLDVLLHRFSLLDRVLLSSVCRPWYNFLADRPSLRRPQFPWIMNFHAKESVRTFYSPSDGGCYGLHLANTKNRMCAATSHGWLLFLDRRGKHEVGVFLVNPLSKACIDLPTCGEFLHHATLSAAPTEPSCVVLGLSRGGCDTWYICHCPIRDKAWHIQREQFVLRSNIAVMGGKLYFLTQQGLAEFDFSQGHPLRWLKLNDDVLLGWDDCTDDELMNPLMDILECLWLVESDGELLLVILLRRVEAKSVAYVYRADFANNMWCKVENLGNRSLFLSRGVCFSLPVEDTSEHVEGCIYLADMQYVWLVYTVGQQSSDRWHGCTLEWMVWESLHYFWVMPTI